MMQEEPPKKRQKTHNNDNSAAGLGLRELQQKYAPDLRIIEKCFYAASASKGIPSLAYLCVLCNIL